jgi:hypothetical protein
MENTLRRRPSPIVAPLGICAILVGAAFAQKSEKPAQYQAMYGGLTPDEARRQLSKEDSAILALIPTSDPEGVSSAMVRTGMTYYNNKDYDVAIRTFNLAWLSKPTSSAAIAALGIGVGARDGACQGATLIRDALKQGPIKPPVAIDAVGILASCIVKARDPHDAKGTPGNCAAVRNILSTSNMGESQQSASEFEIGISALIACSSYEDAWKRVFLMRKSLGHEPRADLLAVLRSLAAEPRN